MENKAKVDHVQFALHQLTDYLHSGPEARPEEKNLQDVYIAFDEAHILSDNKTDPSKWSHFVDLRWALHMLGHASCFSFFLSTTNKILEFAMPQDIDSSKMIREEGLQSSIPFSDLGFDHLMEDNKVFIKYNTIYDVTSVVCVVRMGRPL